MGSFLLWCWARRYEHIAPMGGTVPSRSAGSFHRCVGTVLATDWIILIGHLFEGDTLC
jgi:hypothetical protein